MLNERICIDALRDFVTGGAVAISSIQRKYHLSYAQASNVMTWMERNGYVSEFDGEKSRVALLPREKFEAMYGKIEEAPNGAVKDFSSEEKKEMDLFEWKRLEECGIAALKKRIQDGKISSEYIVNEFQVDYAFACEVLSWLEAEGAVSPFNGEKERYILISQEEFEAKYGNSEEE